MTQSYRPQTIDEQNLFFSNYCDQCKHSDKCSILDAAMSLPLGHPDYPQQWVMEGQALNSRAKCTAFESLAGSELISDRCDHTMDMFGDSTT
jgi:hypothetical protein